MIGCNTDTAVSDTLGAGHLQEVGRGHFPLANHALGNSRLHGRGQLDQDQVLEDTAGAAHGGGIFLIADFEDALRGGA